MADLGELRFVDHVECQIQSPEKEVISPTKSPTSSSFSNFNGSGDSSLNESKPSMNESKNSDSGLDSSNGSTEVAQDVKTEHFIDRQESYTSTDEPSVIISPTKAVDEMFNFLGSEAQSLDAANNNSEAIISNVNVEVNKNETMLTEEVQDVYLGKEVDLHDKGQTDGQNNHISKTELQLNSPDKTESSQATMNLYWYAGNTLAVDLEEIEAFKTSQAETYTSNMQINVGNGYYMAKNQDSTESNSINVSKPSASETKTTESKEESKRSTWSPAFESASSRILDLASELKSDPKSKKNAENTATRNEGNAENAEKHPWGLEREEKVLSGTEDATVDNLPDIDSFQPSESQIHSLSVEQKLVTQEQNSITDEVDATGLMEMTNNGSIAKPVQQSKSDSEDSADAIGYMERQDKPVEIKQVEQSLEVKASKQLKDVPINEGDEDKKARDKETEDSDNEDVADAIGYMEWKDKPVEQIITASEQGSLQVIAQSGATVTASVQNDQELDSKSINRQVIGSEQVENKSETNDDGVDTVDGTKVVKVEAITTESAQMCQSAQLQASQSAQLQASQSAQLQASQSAQLQASQSAQLQASQSAQLQTSQSAQLQASQSAQLQASQSAQLQASQSAQLQASQSAQLQASQSAQLQASRKEPVFDPYTVRRTYKITDNFESLIQNNGGVFIETECIVDEYLDDSEYSLILKDSWLRLRNKKFEMKINAAFGCKTGKTQMLTNESEIKELLLKMYSKELKQKRRVSERHLDVLIDSLGLVEFATFETTRNRYQVGDCIVMVDLTNFGFQVGEIEMVAKNGTEIPAVLNTIEALASQLGP